MSVIVTKEYRSAGNSPLNLLPRIIAVGAFALAAAATSAIAQDPPKPKTTMQGAYTAEQATRGQDIYNSICLSCHTLAEQTGTGFTKKWVGYPLWDLFDYLSVNMPQSDPGTLTPKEYADVIAYLLKLNSMPAGKDEVPVDTASLKAIKVDTTRVDTLRKSSAELMRRLNRNR